MKMSGPHYAIRADGVLFAVLANGDEDRVGVVERGHEVDTFRLLNRAAERQEQRRYTESARLYAKAEPWVTWDEYENGERVTASGQHAWSTER